MPPLPGDKQIASGNDKRGSLAQLVEQLTFNQLVAGSNPARPTILSMMVVEKLFYECFVFVMGR